MIKNISFTQVCELWEYLHPLRNHLEYSNMKYLNGFSNMHNIDVFYFGYYENNKLVGVNSCHMSEPDKFRSRGLYVIKEYRNKNIGKKLLQHTIEHSFKYVDFVWSFPREKSLPVYQRVGFIKKSEFIKADYGMNCYVSIENK